MNFKNTLKFAYDHLSEIEELLGKMSDEDKIPQIEIDLTLSKLRELYDVILLIKNSEKESGTDNRIPEPGLEKDGKKRIVQDNHQTDKNKKQEKEIKQGEKENHVLMEQKDQNERISDRYVNRGVSINENIGTTFSKKDLSSSLQSKPIEDISEAIGLNEKFAMIRELFEGKTEKYESTILTLNEASDFNEAYNFILENFNWDMDSELVQYVLELIRRKFIVSNE